MKICNIDFRYVRNFLINNEKIQRFSVELYDCGLICLEADEIDLNDLTERKLMVKTYINVDKFISS